MPMLGTSRAADITIATGPRRPAMATTRPPPRLLSRWPTVLLALLVFTVAVAARTSEASSVAYAGASASAAAAATDEKFDDEYYDSTERILESSYHGLIKENETVVEITPLIKVDETKICDFHIIHRAAASSVSSSASSTSGSSSSGGGGGHEIPFQIELVNNLGILKTRKPLNCEKHKNYKFDIAAIFCDGSRSPRASVHITVIDINEYSPVFAQPSYVTEVDEGRLYQEIIRVEATDRDCTPLFGDVCKYEILTGDQPFTIDNEGSIRNTEPLSHRISHNHILSVVAYDCAMKQSAPVMVNIRVRRVCEARLMAVPERIEYTANTLESVSLFPKIRLELCDMQCKDDQLVIEASVTLKTKHISFGCDRDTTRCARTTDVVDLLPKDTEWTKDLIYDEGPDSVFHFDGSVGASVPSTLLSHHDFALRPFSVVTQFRHHSQAGADKHTKEHIVCSADDHKMNRHHMALFVRNCRLILLLRKNFNDGDLNIFSPAEWRWKIPQVCDNEWHHYAVNVDLPRVELFIDGARFEANAEDRHTNPEVIDDWPLHAAHGVNTTLTVGACYQGAENRMKHGFSGDISEIRVTLAKTLTAEQIRCGTDCAEHLIPPSEHYLEPAQQVQSNTQLNEISVEGSNKSNIEQLLQRVQYINTKQTPTIGRRNIEVRATVSCPNKKAIRLPTMETYIMVSPAAGGGAAAPAPATAPAHPSAVATPSATPATNHVHDKASLLADQKPHILIAGAQNHLVTYPDIKQGVHFLANVTVRILSGTKVHANLQRLDSCAVSVFPSLNPDHEAITLSGDPEHGAAGRRPKTPAGQSQSPPQLDIRTAVGKDGVEMIGYDTTANYLSVLRRLVYTNKKPAYYLNRVFKLSCAQVSAHFRSAEYTLTLTVLHPKQTAASAAAAAAAAAGQPQQQPVAAQLMQQHETNMFAHAMVHSHDVQESGAKVHNIVHKAGQASHSTLLIVVICGAFVALISGVGIARLRNNGSTGHQQQHSKKQQQPRQGSLDKLQAGQKHIPGAEQQLDWDDSALTITINPMQTDDAGLMAAGGVTIACISDDSCSESENSDSEDDEPNNGRYRNVSQLEWDNSTM